MRGRRCLVQDGLAGVGAGKLPRRCVGGRVVRGAAVVAQVRCGEEEGRAREATLGDFVCDYDGFGSVSRRRQRQSADDGDNAIAIMTMRIQRTNERKRTLERYLPPFLRLPHHPHVRPDEQRREQVLIPHSVIQRQMAIT